MLKYVFAIMAPLFLMSFDIHSMNQQNEIRKQNARNIFYAYKNQLLERFERGKTSKRSRARFVTRLCNNSLEDINKRSLAQLVSYAKRRFVRNRIF